MAKVEKFIADIGSPRMNIIWLANTILRRLHKDRDFYVNAEGEKGSGKSNLTLLLALIMCRYAGTWRNKYTGKLIKVLPRISPPPPEYKQLTVDFDFDKNVSFLDRSEELKDKFFAIDRYMPFIVDEGSKNLHKYGWQNKLQQMLIQLSDTERYQNKSFFVCFPNFKELTLVFRNDRIRMRLYVYARHTKQKYASCIISLRDISRWTSDPWHIEENAKIFESILKRVSPAVRTWRHILHAEKKLKCYAGNFDFPSLKDIAPKIWDIYYKYKIKNAQEEHKPEEPKENLMYKNAINRWKYASKMLLHFVRQNNPDVKWDDLTLLTNTSKKTLYEVYKQVFEDVDDDKLLKQKAVKIIEENNGMPIPKDKLISHPTAYRENI